MRTFNDLIKNKIFIPPYQRAYAWGEKQIDQFVSDLIEMQGKDYYYGHFILEKKEDTFEVIDGQQRITTYVLFLLSAKLYLNYKLSSEHKLFIQRKFQTIEYDSVRFKELEENILDNNKLIEKPEKDTSSIKRIIKAIKTFGKIFNHRENEIKIGSLLETILNAEISIHETTDKKVAVQIFELQNSRGIKLDLIEKFKSRLMKEIYLHSNEENADNNIAQIQEHFSEIYALEEKTEESSFRGDLKLDNILLHHLRVIDDHSKIDYNDFFSPPMGNMEENILNYISDKLKKKEKSSDKEKYILNVTKYFRKSVEFVCKDLIELDDKNPLVGDCLILDKNQSLELFLILLQNNKFDEIDLKNWELLLFTRDFHNRYYRKNYRDNFQLIYTQIFKKNKKINNILNHFVVNGFRGEGDNYKLQEAFVNDVIIGNKERILFNAFNYWKGKMTYLLYKYEIEKFHTPKQLRLELRKLFKKGKSIEHILPQNWKNALLKNIEIDKNFSVKVDGIGNLLIISSSENSKIKDEHPKNIEYDMKEFGSYKEHQNNREKWGNHEEWQKLIDDRSDKIYEFMMDYFTLKVEND